MFHHSPSLRYVCVRTRIEHLICSYFCLAYLELCPDSSDEWKTWNQMGDPIQHIVLRDWADICVVAPLSAHTLAKVANGLCDDVLSCLVRAWDFGHYCDGHRHIHNSNDIDHILGVGKPLLFAPAMNTAMWEHPLTSQHLAIVESFGKSKIASNGDSCVHFISPQSKLLACGDLGMGAMADVAAIVLAVRDILGNVNEIRKSE
jgi:phosphopantothenoylcysteine decarboxylase